MARWRSGFGTALGMFTVIPVPAVSEIDPGLARRTMGAFPLVGAVVGALAAGAYCVGSARSELLGAVLAVAVLALLTGGLHLDGLADTADGLGSRKPAAEALAIMKRSDVGPMGVVTLVMVLLVDVAALAALPRFWAMCAIALGAVTGRVIIVGACSERNSSARPGGFGSLFAGVVPVWVAWLEWILVAALWGSVAWWLLGSNAAGYVLVAGALSGAVGWAWRGHLARRLGGMTGDTFGSIIEVTQLATFLLMTAAFSFS